jgi:hypothetical protein
MPNGELTPQPVTDVLEAGLKEWQAAQEYWFSEEKTRKETLQKIEPAVGDVDPGGFFGWIGKTAKGFVETTLLGKPPTIPGITTPPERESEWQIAKDTYEESVRELGRASFYTNLHSTLQVMALNPDQASTVFGTFDEYLQTMDIPISALSPDDLDYARELFTRGIDATVPPESLEWLEISPEAKEAVEELKEPIKVTPQPMHRITIEEIVKLLTTKYEPTLPEGMNNEELLRAMSLMNIPTDTLAEAVQISELIKPLSEAASEQTAQIEAVLAGLEEWEKPSLGIKEKLMFAMMSPMQVAADIMMPYIEHVSYPLAGLATYMVQQLIPGKQSLESEYNRRRAEGESVYNALKYSWRDWDANWAGKLAIEIFTDPLTYTPGLLLSVPGKALRGTGVIGLRAMGRGMLAFNQGMWDVLDIPFDAFRAWWAGRRVGIAGMSVPGIPKTTKQLTDSELNNFSATLFAGLTAHAKKPLNMITADDTSEFLARCLNAAKRAGPTTPEDIYVTFGRQLMDIAPLEPNEILTWSRSLGGRLTDDLIDTGLVDDVNNILRDTVENFGSLEINAKRLLMSLQVEDSPRAMREAIRLLRRNVNKYVSRVNNVIEIGKTAKVSPQIRMWDALITQQRKIFQKTLGSEYYKARRMSGAIATMIKGIDRVERNRWRIRLDRYFVRPVAETYLGNVSYAFWNIFEGMFVSALEGVIPRRAQAASFLEMFQGILGVDPAMAKWALQKGYAGDPSGMFQAAPGRAGAYSLLPGKIPEKVRGKKLPTWIGGKDYAEWLGRKWIEVSDVWGSAFRANYLTKKMSRYLAEYSVDVNGVNVLKEIEKLIGTPPRLVNAERIGLTEHVLRQELFNALTSGGGAKRIAALKENLTNTALMEKEQLKILREATELSPQSRTIGEQIIQRGDFLRSEEHITRGCGLIADQALSDLRNYSLQVSDAFAGVSDLVARYEMNTADDLMQVFQHYEVMVDTASELPSKMLSKAFDEADELKRLGKFGQVEQLWKTSRKEMQEVMDSVNASMESVRDTVEANIHLLKPEQRGALQSILDKNSARDALRQEWLIQDGHLLDDFWKLPRGERTPEAHTELRAYRREMWDEYRKNRAILGASEFQARRDYAQLYHELPAPKFLKVNAADRALAPQDVANIMGCNVDSLTNGILDVMTMQDRYYFIQMVKQQADRYPQFFAGVTEEKIAIVYDDIIRGLRMSPTKDISAQKILQQVEGIKHQMLSLRMTKSISPAEEKALHGWIDNIAAGSQRIIGKDGIVTDDAWQALRQKASNAAHTDYYKSFADYTNQNMIDAWGKFFFPFWTYHMYRWFYLARLFTRRPGMAAAWGKYYNYTDYGYAHIPGTDIEINPFVGSVFGTTFGLARHDFKSYYENLPLGLGEGLDFMQRRGFFPGIHIMLPIVASPIFTGRPPELGELLPPLHRYGLNLLQASPIDQVKETAQWLQDKFFHENFRDYYVTTIIDQIQAEAGGTLVDGQSGANLWHKRMRGEKLTEEEQELWDRASQDTSWYNMLRSQFPIFRLRATEMLEAYQKVTNLFEAQLGLTEEFQDYLWRHNMRPTDVIGGLPLDLRATLDEMWEWKIWFGRGQVLMPPNISGLYGLMDKYWGKVRNFQDDRLSAQLEIDQGFLAPTKAIHFDGREWRNEYAGNWSEYVSRVKGLEEDEEFADAIDAITPEGQARLAKELGFFAPVRHPLEEALDQYFSIELEKRKDPLTGIEDWDYLGFWLKREAVKMALTEDQRADFEAYTSRYQTPMERVFRDVSNRYLRGYRAVPRIVFDGYPEDMQELIKEYYADVTTLDRKEQIRDTDFEGYKLISRYEARLTDLRLKLRLMSPELDKWLYIFGYTSTLKTDAAREMVNKWERDRGSIVVGIEPTAVLERRIELLPREEE